jgi:tetratricopeptide (TPR) repeat protein
MNKTIRSPQSILLLILLSVVSVFSVSYAEVFPQPHDVETVRHIIGDGFSGSYEVAESLTVSLQNRYPFHPIGYVMQAAMLQSQMMDGEHFDLEDDFYILTKLTEKKCRQMIEENSGDAWVLYCLGLAYGSRAVYYSRAGSWWSTLRYGVKAKKAFSDCIKVDSTFYDAYVGLGSYHYWRSAKTKAINWLPFVPDERNRGLRELELAAEKSLFSGDFARNSLIWVWIDLRRYEEAESLAVEMQNKYPEGREFLWGIAAARLKQDDYLGAEAVFTELIARVREDSGSNNYNLIECRYQLARVYLEAGQYTKCLEQCRLARETDLEQSARKRLKKRLSELKSMEKQAKRTLEQKGQNSS